MKDHNKIQDTFFADLMKNTALEEPSNDFTGKVMEKVRAGEAMEKHTIFFYNRWSWILLLAAAVLIIFVIIFSDFSFISDFFNSLNMENLMLVNMISNVFSSIQTVFHSLQMTTLSGIIILSAVLLFAFDRLIRKLKPSGFLFI